jgi:hypothetical protein
LDISRYCWGSDHGTALEQLVSDVAPEAERPSVAKSLIWCGMRQGTLSAVARSVWLASKLPKLLAGKLRQDYESTRLLSLQRVAFSITEDVPESLASGEGGRSRMKPTPFLTGIGANAGQSQVVARRDQC